MGYIQLEFGFGVLLLLVLAKLIPDMVRVILLSGSIIFLVYNGGWYSLSCLIFVSLFSFVIANKVKSQDNKFLGIVVLVLLLFIHKILQNRDISINSLQVIGISYYTLLAIGYIVDSNDVKSINDYSFRGFFRYLLYLSYFPIIVQGPLVQYRYFNESVDRSKVNSSSVDKGILLIIIGLVKKLVVADRLNIYTQLGFDNYKQLPGIVLYLICIAFSLQIYFDFCGCVDLCRGVSCLFGIILPDNFNRPYFSSSFKEFWGKWHISFCDWLKRYIYIPLGGKEKRNRNIFIVFLVSAMWHGITLSFFIWGLAHAFLRVSDCFLERYKMRKWLKTLIVFNVVSILWILFNGRGVSFFFNYCTHVITNMNYKSWLVGISIKEQVVPMLLLVSHITFVLIIEKVHKSNESIVSSVLEMPWVLRIILYVLMLVDIIIFGVYGSGLDEASFLYGAF